MWGPATKPTTPPATKPTGPPTRAPEAAPSAPSNTRSPAPAAVGANSAAATNADAMTCLMIFLPVGGHTCTRTHAARQMSDVRGQNPNGRPLTAGVCPPTSRRLQLSECSPPPFVRLIKQPPARLKLRQRLPEPIEIFRRDALRRGRSHGS